MLDDERLAQALGPIGLDERESDIYLRLALRGPASAARLADETGLHRAQVYRLARSLMEHGLVRQTIERPVEFVATPLREALSRVERDTEAKVTAIRRLRKQVAPFLATLEDEARPPSTVRILSGRARAFDTMMEALGRARRSVRFMDTHPDAVRNLEASGLARAFDRRATDHVQVRVVLGEPTDRPGARAWQCRVLAETPHRVRWMAVDRREVVVFTDVDVARTYRTATDRALWSDSQHWLDTLEMLFDGTWTNLQP